MLRPAVSSDASRIAETLVFAKCTSYRSIFHNDDVLFNELQVAPLARELLKERGLDEYHVYDDGIVRGVMRFSFAPGDVYKTVHGF